MIDLALVAFGGIDAIVLNAAVFPAGLIDVMPMEEFDRVIGVNLRGTIRGSGCTAGSARQPPGVDPRDGACGALLPDPTLWAYNATKAALVNLVKALALQFGQHIRIKAVCPGPTDTATSKGLDLRATGAYELPQALPPLGRWAENDEIAAVTELICPTKCHT
jgi:NAD(P)-dependent dehydrogenase (short-subunit alcohol dehydrogenase family)